ncbi:MAG: PrgI family protein, partial [Acidimicrobiia bacterium]|nr:PrgI family protein [Acidimicrobiia bacterium]
MLGGLRAGQVGLIAAGGVTGIVVLRLAPSVVGLGTAVVAIGGAMGVAVARIGGRALDEWAPSLCRWIGLRGRRRWMSAAPTAGAVSHRNRTWDRPPPLASTQLVPVEVGGRELGVVEDTRAGTLTAVMAVQGSAFALLDSHAQERRLGAWADVLSGWARDDRTPCRLQWLERTVPEDGDALGEYLRDHVAIDHGHAVVRSYLELLEDAAPLAQRHDTFVALTLTDRPGRRRGPSDADGFTALVRELARLQKRLLAADLNVAGVLSPRQLAGLLRVSLNPPEAAGLARRSAADPDLAGASAASMYPLATDTYWDCYRIDETWHATFWVAEWPRLEVGPDFLAPLLLEAPALRTVSLVMAPVPPAKATKAVEMARTQFLADEELRQKAGFLATARRKREHDAIVRREAELADGHAEYRFSGYVTVSAPDRETLEVSAAEVLHAAQR